MTPYGLKSASEISKEAIKFGLDGARAFLNLTCKPLLEELGLAGKDVVRNWRLSNIVKMLDKAQGKLTYDYEKENLIIDPRVAFQIVEHVSIVSDDTIQEMWAGLFASSCKSYEEDENIFFIDILKRLTSSQVKLLNYLCKYSQKSIDYSALPVNKEEGIIGIGYSKAIYEDIMSAMATTSKLKADSELNALESMGLIEIHGSMNHLTTSQKIKTNTSNLRPSLTAILLYVKCQGSSCTPFEYFLSDIKRYYFNFCNSYIQTTEDEILETLYQMAEIEKKFDSDIQYGSFNLTIKNAEWAHFSSEEFNFRLKNFLIYKNIYRIAKPFSIDIGQRKIGEFDYENGFVHA